jgi:hypothetical protein
LVGQDAALKRSIAQRETDAFSNEFISLEALEADNWSGLGKKFVQPFVVTLPPEALANRKTVAARPSIAPPAGPNILQN